jgi:V/A-type H+/Na+-transporting ATPase subunit B
MSIKEYRTAVEARGGLLVMKKTPGVAFGDRVSIEDHTGRIRNGQVIRASDEEVLILVFEGVEDLDLENTWVRFLDAPVEIALSPELLGREFNGLGEPRDGRPPILSSLRRPVGGSAINPAARTYPREFIQTGISTIDGLNSLVRGQKLPIFTGSGLPHNRLAAQIVRQARLKNEDAAFSIVFAAMGVSYADAKFFRDEFASSGVLRNVVMFVNLADDPPVERLTLPRTALTAAEYLAYDLDRHVLVVMTDMTYYAEALREVATAKGDVPARKGYPGYLYSDLAEIYERCGRIHNRHGSITMMPVGVDAFGRHHPPDPRPHRLHHRGPDRAVARAEQPGHLSAGAHLAESVAADEGRHRQGRHPRGPSTGRGPALCAVRARAGDQEPRLDHRRRRTVDP